MKFLGKSVNPYFLSIIIIIILFSTYRIISNSFLPLPLRLQDVDESNLDSTLANEDRLTLEAIRMNDSSICEGIPNNFVGSDKSGEYACKASVLQSDSFCNEIDPNENSDGWNPPKGLYLRNNCYRYSAIVLGNFSICDKIMPYYTIQQNASLEEKRSMEETIYLTSPKYCKEVISKY